MRKLLSISILTLLIFSCARVSSPTGGIVDEIPPELVSSVPENGQINYKEQTISLTFNEWIKTDNIQSDLIITPKIQGAFKTRIKKETILLEFNEPLQDSTTYTLSFANTIKDITNNNPATGLTLSFATGDYLDSLTITGNIVNLYTQEPQENILVSLYSDSDTTDITNGAASYYTKTDTLGNYTFQNLPSGNFRIFALNDQNNNSIADTENEAYGYYSDTIKLNANFEGADFTYQNLNIERLREVSARPFGKYFDIEFNKTIVDYQELNSVPYPYLKSTRRKIRYFNDENVFNDTIPLIYQVRDSAGLILRDTVSLSFIDSKIEKDEFIPMIEKNSNFLKNIDTVDITFNKPLAKFNIDSIHIQIDSLTSSPIREENIIFDSTESRVSFIIPAKEIIQKVGLNAILTIPEGSIVSIEKDTLEKIQHNIALINPDDIGSISGIINTSSDNVIIQLINARNKEVEKIAYTKNYLFQNLSPGAYLIRVIDDINGNRKWDTGNILEGTFPEPAHYYYDSFYKTRMIELRKRWERVDINISF